MHFQDTLRAMIAKKTIEIHLPMSTKFLIWRASTVRTIALSPNRVDRMLAAKIFVSLIRLCIIKMMAIAISKLLFHRVFLMQ